MSHLFQILSINSLQSLSLVARSLYLLASLDHAISFSKLCS